jgi:hypothetical protein
MALEDLNDWIAEFSEGWTWFAKRLSGNDTLANGSHQAGPYIPKDFLFSVLPDLNRPDSENPELSVDTYIDSHRDFRQIRVIWYNNRLRGGTRNETRLTRFGGSSSALLDPDNTGALAVFAFRSRPGEPAQCRVWVCDYSIEEDLLEERLGPVEPGRFVIWPPEGLFTDQDVRRGVDRPCWLDPEDMPGDWLDGPFPTGAELISQVLQLRPLRGVPPDARLLKRRDCEYELFRSLEHARETPVIQRGFGSLEAFLSTAQSILQRRKSRSGRSLELHVRAILLEDGFSEGQEFSWQAESENGKTPDFLFPSQSHYRDPMFPSSQLRMLGIKTTLKDRWRQVLNEAVRIERKHLLTLQEGVSERQFAEMQEAGLSLVVPDGLRKAYAPEIRPQLISLESFLGDIRLLRVPG